MRFSVREERASRSRGDARPAGTSTRCPAAHDRLRPRFCIRGDAAATPSLPRSKSVPAPNAAPCRRTTTGAAGFAPATSRVSDEAALGRLAQRGLRAAEPRESALRGVDWAARETGGCHKVPATGRFSDGRGGFRTCDLSRVKHGVRGPSERQNTCKSGHIVRPVTARRWAWYGPIRQDLAQRMAQRPAPPRHREALRCALDDRARSRCACGSCLAVSPCPHTCATAAADAVSLRVLDASRPGACSQVPLDSRSRGRQAAGGEARACPSWRPRALPALDERSRFRPTGLRASSSVAPATAPVVDAASRPALLLVVSATASRAGLPATSEE